MDPESKEYVLQNGEYITITRDNTEIFRHMSSLAIYDVIVSDGHYIWEEQKFDFQRLLGYARKLKVPEHLNLAEAKTDIVEKYVAEKSDDLRALDTFPAEWQHKEKDILYSIDTIVDKDTNIDGVQYETTIVNLLIALGHFERLNRITKSATGKTFVDLAGSDPASAYKLAKSMLKRIANDHEYEIIRPMPSMANPFSDGLQNTSGLSRLSFADMPDERFHHIKMNIGVHISEDDESALDYQQKHIPIVSFYSKPEDAPK
ncbi:MAG: hypothetical protein JWN33_449 [Candidatus Saccharibacteria bacterium]|nr:hypothetical protein [Candidatus Saccharibacteria bacterium]